MKPTAPGAAIHLSRGVEAHQRHPPKRDEGVEKWVHDHSAGSVIEKT
jgi:hypothetical protein